MTQPANPSTSVVVISADDLAALIRREVRAAMAEGGACAGDASAVGWLMAGEAARVSGLSQQTLRDLVMAGHIPAWALLEVGKGGGRYRYSAKWCSGEARR